MNQKQTATTLSNALEKAGLILRGSDLAYLSRINGTWHIAAKNKYAQLIGRLATNIMCDVDSDICIAVEASTLKDVVQGRSKELKYMLDLEAERLIAYTDKELKEKRVIDREQILIKGFVKNDTVESNVIYKLPLHYVSVKGDTGAIMGMSATEGVSTMNQPKSKQTSRIKKAEIVPNDTTIQEGIAVSEAVTQNAPDETPEAINIVDTDPIVDEPKADDADTPVTSETSATDISATGDVDEAAYIEQPYSALPNLQRYQLWLEEWDSISTRNPTIVEFQAVLRTLVFELLLSQNRVPDKKLRIYLTKLEKRANELYIKIEGGAV